MAAHISTTQTSRMRTMVIPREHGAWGMLLVPLATGAIAAARSGVNGSALTLFVAAALSLFWLRTPVESWLGTSPIKAHNAHERTVVLRTIRDGALALLSVAALLWSGNRGLIVIGAIAVLAFAAQAGVKKLGRKGRMPAQIIGAIGLTSTAAGAYYVATGRLDRIAVALWVATGCSPAIRFTLCNCAFTQSRLQLRRESTAGTSIPVVADCIDRRRARRLPLQLLPRCRCCGFPAGLTAWDVVVRPQAAASGRA